MLVRRRGRDQKNVHADGQVLVTVGLIERDGRTVPDAELGASPHVAA
ncbi:hypothetical protein [Rhodocista pekingensis]|uniref:Transposase n=1 Tax=Rhodocista pekingensis TaxID=201185 RepID=A0ABW2KTE8_9PROT